MERILIIEDEAPIRENLAWLLEAHGYAVCQAADGREGIERARALRPDLVLCDVMMPELDGHGVLGALRADAATATTPLIFLTARAGHDDVRAGMTAGASDYLPKPFTAHDVVEAVRVRLAEKARHEAQAERRLDELRLHIAASLPHELRTPLTAILGFSDLLLDEWPTFDASMAQDLVRTIRASGVRLERTVDNYTFFAHLVLVASDPAAHARLRHEVTPGAASRVAEAAYRVAEGHARPGDLQLDLHDGPAPIGPVSLDRAVNELVDNAFKFSGEGTAVVVRAGTDAGAFQLVVDDQGRGLSVADAGRTGAFLQFDRAAYEHQGSGLGLAIVHRLAALHGGTLTLDSRPGRGTTARLVLPQVSLPEHGGGDGGGDGSPRLPSGGR